MTFNRKILTFPDPQAMALSIRATALVFEDRQSQALLERIKLVAPSEASVLVYGETGTGKELIARHVHALSHRSSGSFVAVNCGAFSETLVESELFGHEKGAFTGATHAKAGWFEAADGGTLFLDEIGDLPLSMQVKLLRVLQEREVVRLGSRQPVRIDVRLIAATNVKLEQAVAAGHFREDLFYRLNVAALKLLPLRERPDDILPLARHFLGVYSHRLGLEHIALAPEAERLLRAHVWPGNIRELENVVHHALLVCSGTTVHANDLHLSTMQIMSSVPVPSNDNALETALLNLFERTHPDLYAHIEEVVMRTAYQYCHHNQLQTARLLGISRNVVRARLLQIGEIISPQTRAINQCETPETIS